MTLHVYPDGKVASETTLWDVAGVLHQQCTNLASSQKEFAMIQPDRIAHVVLKARNARGGRQWLFLC